MSTCSICGEPIVDGSRTCSVCGSNADDMLPRGTMLGAEPAAPGAPLAFAPTELPPGGGYCPVCIRVYGPEHTDGFCSCGTELLKEGYVEGATDEVPMAPILDELPPMAPILEDPPIAPALDEPTAAPMSREVSAADLKVRPIKPAAGTTCLTLYGSDKQPLQYFALTKDTTLIGRLDAVAGNFPDIDLDQWFDRSTIRKISRQHALVLRSRATREFSLRPLLGNTGTQLEGALVEAQQDYPLKPGYRIIIGGVIRLKFEIT